VRLYAVRYASGPEVNTLFVSEDPASVRMLYPDNEGLDHFGDDARVVVSEPLTQLPGMWREVPPGSALIIGRDTRRASLPAHQPDGCLTGMSPGQSEVIAAVRGCRIRGARTTNGVPPRRMGGGDRSG
jgi:hypothetical protein